MSQWFRFYGSTLNNRKAQSLPGDLFKAWVNILCLACSCDGKPMLMDDIIFALRMTPAKCQAVVDELIERNLLDDTETGLRPHDWDERQYKSDVSNDRVERHRQRKRNGECNVTVTPPEQSRTDTEQIRKKEVAADAAPRARKSTGEKLPEGWMPSGADREYGLSLGLSEAEIAAALEEMRDWAKGNSNRAIARKADWSSAFKGWLRRNSKEERKNGTTENLSAVARRFASEAISFGPKPNLGGSGDEPDSPPVRLLSQG